MPEHAPAPKGSPRHALGVMLTHYREQAGLTREELSVKAQQSASLIRSYEEAWRVPVRDTLIVIDAVPELNTHGALVKLWDEFEESMSYQVFPEAVQDWFEDIEPYATRLRNFESNLVPGLLQTSRYATALSRTRFGISDDEITNRTQAKMRRQRILDRDEPAPPTLQVIVDEWALRRPIGGQQVMHEQILHLAEIAHRPLIVIRVLPASVGAHEGLPGGGFVIAEFDDTDKPKVAYQEGAISGGQLVKDRKDVATLESIWDTLRDEALPRGASLATLEETAKSWTSPE